MLDFIPPFDYKGKRVSAQIPPGRAALPRPMLWIVTINNLKVEGFLAVAGETAQEVRKRIEARVDAALAGLA